MIDFFEKAEIVRIEAAIDAFATQMKAVMVQKAKQGKRGWDNCAKDDVPDEYIAGKLYNDAKAILESCGHDHYVADNALPATIHIATRCMMLWFRHNEDNTAVS